MKKNKERSKGFTLVELLVVIAILAILASVSVVGYMSFTKKANLSADREEANQASRALQSYLVLNPNVDLNNGAEVADAVLAATDNTYDIRSKELRSKGYSLWFNTKTQEIEVLDKIESTSNVKNARKNIVYNTLDAFLWSENTPYLYLSQTGNKFADLIASLNNGTYSFSDLETLNADLKEANKEYYGYFENTVLFIDDTINDEHSLVGYKLNTTVNKDLYASAVKTVSGVKEANVLTEFNIPSHIDEVKTGTFSNQENVTVKIYSEDINLIGNNPVSSGSEIQFVVDPVKEISEILHYSKEEINVKLEDANFKLFGTMLKDEVGNKVAEVKLDETSYTNVIKIGEEFTSVNKIVLENKYDVLEEKLQNQIVNLNEQFNNLLDWEKDFYKKPDSNLGEKYDNYYNEYQKFYNETDRLNIDTGTYTRYLMYKDAAIKLIASFKNITINYDSTSKSISLIEKLNVNNVENNLPFEITNSYQNQTTIPFSYLFNVTNTGTAFVLKDNVIYTTLNGGNAQFTIDTKVNNSNDNHTFTLNNPNIISGVEFLSVMKTNTPETNYLTHLPIYGKNNLIFGFRIEGHLDEVMLNDVENEVKSGITLKNDKGNDVTSKFKVTSINKINDEEGKYNYYLTLDFVSKENDLYYVIEVSVGNGSHELPFRVNLESKNISTAKELNRAEEVKKAHEVSNGINSASLTNDIIFAESGIDDGYYVENDRLVYKTSANAGNHSIIIEQNFTVNGNGYKVDASNDTSKADGNSMFIELRGGTLNNMHVKLGIGTTYDRNTALNISGACVQVTVSNSVINNCYIDGGLRGVRIVNGVDINNTTFKNNIVALELYQGSTAQTFDVNINNVKVDAKIDNNSSIQNASTHTIGIAYFPGNSGNGINNFHNITLKLNNYLYNGWINIDEALNTVNSLIVGISEKLDIAKFSKKDIEAVFKDQTTIKNGQLVNVGILLPTKLIGNLSKEWSNEKNILGNKYNVAHDASKKVVITIATVRLFMLNTINNDDEIAKTFDMANGQVISLNNHDFIYS